MKEVKSAMKGKRSPVGSSFLGILLIVCCLVLGATSQVAAEELYTKAQAPAEEDSGISPDRSRQPSLDVAIEQARQKVTADPTSEAARTVLGYLLLKKGSFEEAGKAFDEALSLNARYHEAMTGKGISLARLGEEEAAEEMLQSALALNPNPVRTYYELGCLYEKKGDFEKALIEYKKGLEKYKQGRR